MSSLLTEVFTVYSPLVRLGAGPGKKVAISGMGGLGHFAVMFAAALGAEVYVLSHSPDKKDDALKLGAKEFIDINKEEWYKPYKFNMSNYFSTLKVMGRFHCVGFGDYPLPEMMAQDFAPNGCYFGASHIGNRPEMIAMLELAAKQNLKSWIETVPISAKGCAEVVKGVYENKVRYRYVLTDYDKEFGQRT